jgi:putative addiction module component (TIGR02574 family)
MDFETIERESLNLPVADRAKLAHELLESLDDLPPQEIDMLWMAEAERRWKAFEAGEMAAIPAEEVMRKARALLR